MNSSKLIEKENIETDFYHGIEEYNEYAFSNDWATVVAAMNVIALIFAIIIIGILWYEDLNWNK